MNTILLSCLFSPDELPFMKEGRIAASKKIIVTVKLPWPVAGTDLDFVLCNVLDKFRGCPEMTSSIGGRGGISQIMTVDDRGGGGVSQIMTL